MLALRRFCASLAHEFPIEYHSESELSALRYAPEREVTLYELRISLFKIYWQTFDCKEKNQTYTDGQRIYSRDFYYYIQHRFRRDCEIEELSDPCKRVRERLTTHAIYAN